MKPIRVFREHTANLDIDLHIWLDKLATKHGHDYYEFAICNEGTIIHYLNDDPPQKLKEKQAFFITPEDVHSIEAMQGATHINIGFLPKVFLQLCEYFGLSFSGDTFKNHTITLTDGEFLRVIKCVHEAFQDTHHEKVYDRALRHLLMEIFSIFLQHEGENAEEDKRPAWIVDFVKRVCSPECYEMPIAQLYALSGYSQPVVTQTFKKHYQTSFVQYFTQRKIEYACGLLRSSNLSILDISNRIGFSSLSHFNAVFKRLVGATPARYRKG